MAKKKGIFSALDQMMAERPDLDKKIMEMKKSFDEVNNILKSDKKKK